MVFDSVAGRGRNSFAHTLRRKIRGRSAIILMGVLILHGCSSKPPTAKISSVATSVVREDFPLSTGSYWIYQGKVKWQDGTQTRESPITWKMAVARSEQIGKFNVSFVQGHPEDLAWYVPGKARENHVIVSADGKYYELTAVEDLSLLLSDETEISKKLSGIPPFMELPLRPGSCYEKADCWEVGVPLPAKIEKINTPVVRDDAVEYKLEHRSPAGHTSLQFVPGIGITSYVYERFGTPGEAEVQLVEFHPGGN